VYFETVTVVLMIILVSVGLSSFAYFRLFLLSLLWLFFIDDYIRI
jgi:hypothetical protein